MIDPRTTDIVGQRVAIVRRSSDPETRRLLGRGIVRVVDYQGGGFALLVEAVGPFDEDWFGSVSEGSLLQVSTQNETIELVVDRGDPES